MAIWQYLILFFSVIFGGGIAFYLKRYDPKILQMVMSFCGAYILGITILHLLPTVFAPNENVSHLNISLFILLGFIIQLLLEKLSGGVEHGHIHAGHNHKVNFAIQVMIGLCIHSLFEGIPLGNYGDIHEISHQHHGHHHGHQHFFWGIILHKAPAAFALVLLFIESKFKSSHVFILLVIFASMSPLGAVIGEFIGFNLVWEQRILAIVVGSFLHIATTIIFEIDGDSHHHGISWSKFAIIILGFGLALLTNL